MSDGGEDGHAGYGADSHHQGPARGRAETGERDCMGEFGDWGEGEGGLERHGMIVPMARLRGQPCSSRWAAAISPCCLGTFRWLYSGADGSVGERHLCQSISRLHPARAAALPQTPGTSLSAAL
jgi:hypothetical protein